MDTGLNVKYPLFLPNFNEDKKDMTKLIVAYKFNIHGFVHLFMDQ